MDRNGCYENDGEREFLLGNFPLFIYHIEHAKTLQVVQVTLVARDVTRCNSGMLGCSSKAFVFTILSHSTVHQYTNRLQPIEANRSWSMPAMEQLNLGADDHRSCPCQT